MSEKKSNIITNINTNEKWKKIKLKKNQYFNFFLIKNNKKNWNKEIE